MRYMMIPDITMGSHPVSRFLAGWGLLFAAIMCHSLLLSVLYLTLSVCLIRLLEGSWLTVIRLFRLLRWFVMPILFLHALFSPGALIFPGLPLPLTWEGINQGVWLSVHLSTIFAAALLLSRLLQRSEWMHALMLLSFASKRIIILQMMMSAMKINITGQLRHLRQQWKLRSDWRMAALFVLASFCMALAAGRDQARMLWLRWPTAGNGMYLGLAANEQQGSHSWMLSLVWFCAGLTTIGLAWL